MAVIPGRAAVVALAAALATSLPAAAAPRVVATVLPVHSLVAAVMAGAGEPELLIRGAGSPHTYALKPSDARVLAGAQVIFWIGGTLETFLEKPLRSLGTRARIVELSRSPGVRLLPSRSGGPWEPHHGDAAGGAPHEGSLDGHLWLDPDNARAIARIAAQALGEADPANRERYAANSGLLEERIAALDAGLGLELAPVREVPFVVFHDAYQYFERRYGLRAVGSVAVSPERRPGARRVREIRERIRALGARCVFSEPQFPAALIDTLLEGADARTGVLDPLGTDLPPGPDAWFVLMRRLGGALAACLRVP